MGMGEPLYNFDNVRDAVGVLSDGDGLAHFASGASPSRPPASCRRSTGSAPRPAPMLAISLHAVRDELRDELVPLNKKYPIKELARTPAATIPAPPTRGASPSNM